MSNVLPFPSRPVADSTNGMHPAEAGRLVYTVAETAHVLNLSLGTTYALLRSGEIPGRKVGGQWVISVRRLHQWVDEPATATTEDTAGERGHRRNA